MVVILTLLFFITFLTIDWFKQRHDSRVAARGTMFTTPGFEFMGALAQDGGTPAPKPQGPFSAGNKQANLPQSTVKKSK